MTNQGIASKQSKGNKRTPAAPAGSDEGFSRRRFLQMTLGGLGLLAALEIGGVAWAFLQPPQDVVGNRGRLRVGKADDFPPGSVTEFVDGRFYLIRNGDGGFLAIYRRCPHLGCTVNWLPQEECFHCPCHASTFDICGEFEDSPSPRPLDTFAIAFDEGEVVVDTTRNLQRERNTPVKLAFP